MRLVVARILYDEMREMSRVDEKREEAIRFQRVVLIERVDFDTVNDHDVYF
jgi:hypothetical protein